MRPSTYGAAAAAALAGAALILVLVPRERPPAAAPPTAPPQSQPTQADSRSMGRCATCHDEIVAAYRGHGMSRSIGPAGAVTAGTVVNPQTKHRYEIAPGEDGAVLTATTPEGGRRTQRIVGRIGAGIFDTSWVAAEIDAATGKTTERLFFAPVETVTGHGLQLSPFELHTPSRGVDMALTNDCLTCHTTDVPRPPPFPANDLGADAFTRLAPLTCSACHGEIEKHADIMSGRASATARGLGLARLGRMSPGAQRDVCARCHLQGDVRIELVSGPPSLDRPLSAQIPVLVPKRPVADFRFVSQLERLALSACFKRSPAMTCTSCHDPHSGVAAQGVARFDTACLGCHAALGSRPHTTLVTADVTGEPAGTRVGCVDCHVRRSQPFDLPHVGTADHYIRRRIERPDMDVPHRQFSAREGQLALYDDGRLAAVLATAEGRRWESGLLAIGLMTLGRFRDAATHFESFPSPGTAAARTPAAPTAVVALETSPVFHTMRGFALMGAGRLDAARAAFSDAIALNPRAADARLARARLSLDMGDVRGAMLDTQAVIDMYPAAEHPWDLRIEIARRAGRPDLALSAADASTRLWPSNAAAWLALASAADQRGDAARARRAFERARALAGGGPPEGGPHK